MTCKHCEQPIERRIRRVKVEPQLPADWEYVHLPTHLFGCFRADGTPTGTHAEAK